MIYFRLIRPDVITDPECCIQATDQRIILSLLFIICTFGHINGQASLRPNLPLCGSRVEISNEVLQVIIANNEAFPPNHRKRYNGIAAMVHEDQLEPLFVPEYAGFNLEHIFAGDSLIELFEPRRHPMSLHCNGAETLLYQPPTPLSGLESLTTFSLDSHYLDISFSCRILDTSFFRHGYAGLFWASYINHPRDKRIHFIGSDQSSKSFDWLSTDSPSHGAESTHLSHDDTLDLYFDKTFNATLANHFSKYVYQDPFYFGRYKNMVLIYMFDSEFPIRFTQSPTGGGQHNPAWDFQWIITQPQIGKMYQFRARLVYKRFISKSDVQAEYLDWKSRN